MAKSTREMSLLDHLGELRRRLIISVLAVLVAAVGSFVLYDGIIAFFYEPFQALEAAGREEVLFVNTLLEGFLIKVKVALLAGLAFSLPVHVYNLVGFVLPGLTRRERRVVVVSLVASSILAVLSVYYGYATVIPISIAFLTGADFIPDNVGMLLNFGKNIFYVFRFLLVTLLLFQVPVVLEILMALNVVKRKTLLKASRIAIVLTFVVAALLTPPDFVSQLSLALPMILLFFLTLLIARIFGFGNTD